MVVLAYLPQPWLLPRFSSNDTLGGCGCPEMRNASGRQIIGSNGWSLDTLLGGTVLYPPVRRLRAETNWHTAG